MTRIEPGIPNMVVLTSDRAARDKDGDWRLENDYVVPPNVIEQFRQGYRCMACLAVQTQPFPAVCEEVYKDGGGCGFPIRSEQPELFAGNFGGDLDRFATDAPPDDVERRAWEAGIVLPPGFSG